MLIKGRMWMHWSRIRTHQIRFTLFYLYREIKTKFMCNQDQTCIQKRNKWKVRLNPCMYPPFILSSMQQTKHNTHTLFWCIHIWSCIFVTVFFYSTSTMFWGGLLNSNVLHSKLLLWTLELKLRDTLQVAVRLLVSSTCWKTPRAVWSGQ